MSLTSEEMVSWCQKLIDKSPDFPPLEQCLEAIPALKDLADLPAGTKVLIRGDTDVVFNDRRLPEDDSRVRSMIETLKFGAKQGWIQILFGHRGRDASNSLRPLANYLTSLLQVSGIPAAQITVIDDWMNDETGEILDSAAATIAKLKPGQIVCLENTRKYKLETSLWKVKSADLPALAPRLVNYAAGLREKVARVHVNEGFASSNRDLSSTIVPVAMDRFALGEYIDNEMRTHLQKTRQAELVIFSGLKLEKLDDLQMILNRGQVKVVITAGNLAMALKKADAELSGGTFSLGAAENPANDKIYISPERIAQAKEMLKKGRSNSVEFVLPVDFILEDGSAVEELPPGGAQFDVGPKTRALHQQKVGEFLEFHKERVAAGTGAAVVFHNGVFGMFEKDQFSNGTRKFIEQLKRMTDAGLLTYVGGGEGGTALHRYGNDSWVTHCFTAGGTILKALGTEPIPYIKALYLAAQRKA